jgi:hypothetical protein
MMASSNPITVSWDAASAEERGRFYIERELQLHTALLHVNGPMTICPDDEDSEYTNPHKPTWLPKHGHSIEARELLEFSRQPISQQQQVIELLT